MHESPEFAAGVCNVCGPRMPFVQLDQHRFNAVKHLYRGRWIVDRGGERSDCDVDEHPHHERGVLVNCALPRKNEYRSRFAFGELALAAMNLESVCTRGNELADLRHDLDDSPDGCA